ncbi:uncharacterized protein LOC113517421 isoform X2 [Galleria mellonella]|nr:uncharacterized protein LOC113517421 isoform X2 [Galleria mellonella]XP_031768412.1 uncharacterized protein LOC113517421 isoform X2 [Galleria mellonella]
MKQYKIAVGTLIIGSAFITLFLYCRNRYLLDKPHAPRARLKTIASSPAQYIVNKPMRHMPLDEIYPDKSNDDYSFEFSTKRAEMIDTPGCQIPVALINYREETSKKPGSCGRRAVFLKKIGIDKVQVSIKSRIMKKYLRKSITYHCCYKFISRSNQPGHEHINIKYTNCQHVEDGATVLLETDFINIKCFEHDKRNTTHVIYNDVYGFIKKINVTKPEATDCKEKYNVLMLGMDSMSLPHVVQTMSRTVNFLKDNYWPGFRGFHKVGDNTLPNLMATFTGKNISTISQICSGKMDDCNDLLIWSTFKEAGYVTAYGEDYIKLPDTFSKDYVFKRQPTDHYMRTLFLSGETVTGGQNLLCAGKESSGQQILNFAFDFSNTYRNESFFGVFWLNSYSHNPNSRPQNADKMFENFFNQLTYSGVLSNTFIIFFSDHGIRFGDHRLKVESYYDERMPFLFMWIPTEFRSKNPDLYKAIVINQFRLVTPYDLYNTLIDINKMATCNNTNKDVSEGCPNCQSLFEVVSANRTCRDAAINDKWCSCHKLYPLDIEDSSGVKSVLHVVSYIQTVVNSMKTQKCWGCMPLSLKKIHRIHFYYDNNKSNLYYVVAFLMNPGNTSYEATVLQKGKEMEIIGPVSYISAYKGLGKCTFKARDRLFCICKKKC